MARHLFYFLALLLLKVAASPEDPHVPRCYNVPSVPFISKSSASQPCAWFEGWYTRIVDPTSGNSFAAIVGTINGTGESKVTLLACYSSDTQKTCSNGGDGNSCEEESKPGDSKGADSEAEIAWKAVGGGSCGQLRLADVTTKGAMVSTHGHPVVKDPSTTQAPDLEWTLPGHGFIKITGEATTLDLAVGEISLKATLTNQKGWKEGDRAASPEGWTGRAASFLLPCRWYIHSLGSEAKYVFTNGSVVKEGSGWAHEEKNWGKMFPDGHVWAQAMSPDNTVQFVLAIVYFKVLGFTTPYLVSLGYRSPNLQQDFRNVDLLSFVTESEIEPCAGKINILAHTLSHSIRLQIEAPLHTFGPKLLAPTSEAKWEPLCQESFSATAKIGVWQRNDTWARRFKDRFNNGLFGKNVLIDRYNIPGTALEFGEGLLCENVALQELKEAAKKEAKQKSAPSTATGPGDIHFGDTADEKLERAARAADAEKGADRSEL